METSSVEIESGKNLHILKVNLYDDKLISLINKYLVKICEGDDSQEIIKVKKRLLKFIESKQETTKMGAIAEFFIHLYLNDSNYKQEFLFFNLEETSIKKGFDGVYTKENEMYIIESKSGDESTKTISHISKLKEAYSDLKKYFDGSSQKGNNNPWRNAYNHASHSDIKANDSLRKQIRELANLYDDSKYGTIEEYNIIPCSTIFLSNNWNEQFITDLLKSTNELKGFEAKKVDLIILTKLKILNFINFLNSEN